MNPSLQMAMIGLGRMGGNMARRLARGGVHVWAFDAESAAREALASEPRVTIGTTFAQVAEAVRAPRVVWLMLPAGRITDDAIAQLAELLAPGDVVVDGGNANYRDSQRRGVTLDAGGLRFVDCGVSGGVWGLEQGYALMFGGPVDAARVVEPFVRILAPAPDRGWLHCGPSGAGHFVKMIHNGIEYGMMQAFAEGFALMANKNELGLDVAAIAETWRHGSVVRSWLLDLVADVLRDDPSLAGIAPLVADSGEGRWAAIEAVEQGIPAPVMSLALMMRFASQDRADYAHGLLAMLRQRFGGHAVQRSGGDG
jgi:6-phosphogluconate dehydrogenase